jgi:transposase
MSDDFFCNRLIAKAYTLDLRKKTIELVVGKKISVTVVSRKTIYAWMKRPSLQKTPRLGKRSSFTDFDALAEYVLKNNGVTAVKIAQHFKTTAALIDAALNKLKFSLKKA